MRRHIKKYYTYGDEFPDLEVSKRFCEETIKQIVKTYKKESIFRLMSYFAQAIGLGNDFNELIKFQQREFNIPPTREEVAAMIKAAEEQIDPPITKEDIDKAIVSAGYPPSDFGR